MNRNNIGMQGKERCLIINCLCTTLRSWKFYAYRVIYEKMYDKKKKKSLLFFKIILKNLNSKNIIYNSIIFESCRFFERISKYVFRAAWWIFMSLGRSISQLIIWQAKYHQNEMTYTYRSQFSDRKVLPVWEFYLHGRTSRQHAHKELRREMMYCEKRLESRDKEQSGKIVRYHRIALKLCYILINLLYI